MEDDPSTISALRAILTRRGWDVQVAGTLAEALKLLNASVRCILLDLMLPDGNGVAVLRAVRDQRLPAVVVVTTGVNDSSMLAEVNALRPTATLQKPINLAQFFRLLPPLTQGD